MWVNKKDDFEKLFFDHYGDLCEYAGRFIADKSVTEDIVQNYFITLWEKKHLSVKEKNFLPYSYRAIRNSCINYLKTELNRQEILNTLAEEWENRIEESEFIHKEEIRLALRKLADKPRKILLLKCLSELTYKEIAEVTGISVDLVKYYLGKAFRVMRDELKHLKCIFF